MNPRLTTPLSALALVVAVPAAALAGGNGNKDHAKSDGHGHGKGKQTCKHGGKGYEVQGLLAAGSALSQVAGADTARRGDDRYSGTLVVQVKQGNRRGRADVGLSSYAVSSVRAKGTVTGAAPLPAVGSRVLLVGKQAKACVTPTTPTTPATPTASASSLDEPTPATTPVETTPATTPVATTPAEARVVTDVVVRQVVFKRAKGQHVSHEVHTKVLAAPGHKGHAKG